jgi:hypothetical protein
MLLSIVHLKASLFGFLYQCPILDSDPSQSLDCFYFMPKQASA